ncbi:MAG: riboflavin synthase [Bacteriovoracaceae bacterium]|nr:riboflavin synthase [Bacteriovoracaceae bacterium]
MFTGLIQNLGEVVSLTEKKLIVSGDLPSSLKNGDSIAVNGVCLTVTEMSAQSFSAHLSSETLARTTCSSFKPKMPVNLEFPMLASEPLGGHIVQGHVDNVGEIVSIEPSGDSFEVTLSYPSEIESYIVEKGSIAVDGVSLTVNSLKNPRQLRLMIIPHTWNHTIFKTYSVGQKVNLEVDIFAKYVQRALGQFKELRFS